MPLDAHDPARRQVGALTYLGGVALRSSDRAFGGFSSLAVAGDRFTLLSDGGNIVRFRMGADWRPRDVAVAELPAGPRTGRTKSERDAESMTADPRTGRIRVGFEVFNQIWRYAPGFARADRGVVPVAVRKWRSNGGIESMARLVDGRFVAIVESREPRGAKGGRTGLVWWGDPTVRASAAFLFTYHPAPDYDPADMTELPDRQLLVLERAFALPFAWSNRLVIVSRDVVRPGAVVEGWLVACLAAPLVHDNIEGIAAVREGDATILWLVSTTTSCSCNDRCC